MVLLHAWQLLKDDLGKSTQAGEAAGLAINALVGLHHAIWDELYGKAILPHADTQHGVSSAISSMSAVDVNRKLFEMVGRIAPRGLRLVWIANGFGQAPQPATNGESSVENDELES